jgi:hypothetical protein
MAYSSSLCVYIWWFRLPLPLTLYCGGGGGFFLLCMVCCVGFTLNLGRPTGHESRPCPRERDHPAEPNENRKKMIWEYEGRSRCGSRHVRLSLSACRRACLTPPPRFSLFLCHQSKSGGNSRQVGPTIPYVLTLSQSFVLFYFFSPR